MYACLLLYVRNSMDGLKNIWIKAERSLSVLNWRKKLEWAQGDQKEEP